MQPAPAPPEVPMPAPAEEPTVNVGAVPWDRLFPKTNVFRDILVQHALPRLYRLLKDPTRRLKRPRDLVDESLEQCKSDGEIFWGKYGVYTRKRSAADAILCHYFSTLQDYAAGRAV